MRVDSSVEACHVFIMFGLFPGLLPAKCITASLQSDPEKNEIKLIHSSSSASSGWQKHAKLLIHPYLAALKVLLWAEPETIKVSLVVVRCPALLRSYNLKIQVEGREGGLAGRG